MRANPVTPQASPQASARFWPRDGAMSARCNCSRMVALCTSGGAVVIRVGKTQQKMVIKIS